MLQVKGFVGGHWLSFPINPSKSILRYTYHWLKTVANQVQITIKIFWGLQIAEPLREFGL